MQSWGKVQNVTLSFSPLPSPFSLPPSPHLSPSFFWVLLSGFRGVCFTRRLSGSLLGVTQWHAFSFKSFLNSKKISLFKRLHPWVGHRLWTNQVAIPFPRGELGMASVIIDHMEVWIPKIKQIIMIKMRMDAKWSMFSRNRKANCFLNYLSISAIVFALFSAVFYSFAIALTDIHYLANGRKPPFLFLWKSRE